MLDRVSLEVVHRMRPRSYQAHLSAQHIQELRKFIDAEFPEPLSAARDAWIVLHLEKRAFALVRFAQRIFLCLRLFDHRSQLVAFELSSFFSHAQCRIERRTARITANPDGGERQD